MPHETTWQAARRLIDDQRYAAASEVVEELLAAARGRGDDDEILRALVRLTQLRVALHGYEEAVRFVQDETWPSTQPAQLVHGLVYGQTLYRYFQAYRWQIEQRQARAPSSDDAETDLDTWTAERIILEIERAYAGAWNERAQWGDHGVGRLARFLEENGYPPRIRGTLRDVVSHLWVELLADRSLWQPEDSAAAGDLDLDALLAETPADRDLLAQLGDAGVHPLSKIHFVLADLEAWHHANDRPEASFDARRSLISRLHDALSDGAARARLRGALQAATEELGRSYPWWSMGQADRAEMIEAQDDPWALSDARDLAESCRIAQPETLGGRRCERIVQRLELPRASLQASTTDGPRRRSIEVRHANLERLHFRAYRIDDRDAWLGHGHRRVAQNQRDVFALVEGTPTASWQEDLPPTPDLRQHVTFVTPPLDQLGPYVVVASARADFSQQNNLLLWVRHHVTHLVLSVRSVGSEAGSTDDEGGLVAEVRSGDDGTPLAGVDVRVWRSGRQPAEAQTVRTGASGEARVALGLRSVDVMAERGEDWVHLQTYAWTESPQPDHLSALLYTDRAVYRPGQDLHWKVIVFENADDGRRKAVETGREVRLVLLDANGEEAATIDATTNAWGSASGTFELPAGRLLGGWTLRAEVDSSSVGEAGFRVEEYKRPTFEVTLQDPEESLRLGEPSSLTGEARYYFGLPVGDAEVSWRVERVPLFPWWWHRFGPSAGGHETVASGEARTDADGRFEVEFVPEADAAVLATERGRRISYRFRLVAEVTDAGGETRDAERAFPAGFVTLEVSSELAEGVAQAGEALEIGLVRRGLEGTPRAGGGTWSLHRLTPPEPAPRLPAEMPADRLFDRPSGSTADPEDEDVVAAGEREAYRTKGDELQPRWTSSTVGEVEAMVFDWSLGEEIAGGEVSHGDDGKAEVTLGACGARLTPGAYRLVYRTADEDGHEVLHERSFVVYPRRGASARGPSDVALSLALEPAASRVAAGERLAVLVHTGFAEQAVVFEVWRGSQRLRRQVLTDDAGSHWIDLAITDADRGGLVLRADLVRDHQHVQIERRIDVPWRDKALQVELATFRDRLRPGDEETWTLSVRGPEGRPLDRSTRQATELLASMYDRSLDLFARLAPQDPVTLWPMNGRVPSATTTAQRSDRGRHFVESLQDLPADPTPRGDELRFFDGYPIGGPGQRGRMRTMAMGVAGSGAPETALMARGESLAVESMAKSAERPQESADAAPASPKRSGAEPPTESGADESRGGEGALRTNFSETAFWEPHLLLDEAGTVSFRFTVPDAVTEWRFWSVAVTRGLRGGVSEASTRSVRELLVRPYLPRFFREGDRAELRVVVSNAGDETLTGTLDFDIVDPAETGTGEASRLDEFGLAAEDVRDRPFTVEPGRDVTLRFPVTAPRHPGLVAVKVIGRAEAAAGAGTLSDGELRPLPVLPSRLRLAQSRFAALEGRAQRTLRFDQLLDAESDPSLETESLVVTLDGQLLATTLHALPYLVSYPHECTEQTMNRFVSAGILSRVFADHPLVAELARGLAEERREDGPTPLAPWQSEDPNRRVLLVETPWLVESRGGETERQLQSLLDPENADSLRRVALDRLRQAQNEDGGFPWFPGGASDPYITLYLLDGFSRALEFGVGVPREPVERAWGFLHQHYRTTIEPELGDDGATHLPRLVYLGWLLSAYPEGGEWTGGAFDDADHRRIVDYAFRHWRELAPRLKGYLSLTLARLDRRSDAETVWASVMDSARTDEDLGTYWAPEEMSWLWYRDTLETHAFALRVLTELDPDHPAQTGLVQWLLLQKKLSHWKSTRATAEVIYSLVHYMDAEDQLGVREEATVTLAPQTPAERQRRFVFETAAERRQQWVVDEVEPALGEIRVEKETPGFLFASATWHFATEELPPRAEGDLFGVERDFFRRQLVDGEWTLSPLADGARLEVGDQVEVHLVLRAGHEAEYVHLRDPRGAGFEPVDLRSGYEWRRVPHYREIRDSGTNFFFDRLPVGEYVFRYRQRAAVAGTFRVGPAQVQSMYAPEFVAYSSGAELEIVSDDSPE